MERRKNSLKVLLVDSDEKFLHYEKEVLFGLVSDEIYTALDGERAFDIFCEYYPDIILTEIDLPLMNGFELISKIRETNSEIDSFLMVIAANNDITDEALALKLGANNYLHKPIEPVRLISHFTSAVNMISSAIELKFEKYLLERNSYDDVITGLISKDYLFKRFREETSKAYRYKRNLSFMRLDFDEFETRMFNVDQKTIQEVLKQVSTVMKGSLRKCDIIGRLEGSKFGILLPETDIFQAKTAGVKLQNKVAETEFIIVNEPINITISIGISSNASQTDETNGIFDRAEEALQNARLSGTNSLSLLS